MMPKCESHDESAARALFLTVMPCAIDGYCWEILAISMEETRGEQNCAVVRWRCVRRHNGNRAKTLGSARRQGGLRQGYVGVEQWQKGRGRCQRFGNFYLQCLSLPAQGSNSCAT